MWPSTITDTMQMYFTGMSVRDIAVHYEMMRININASSVYRWITKYFKMVETILKKLFQEPLNAHESEMVKYGLKFPHDLCL